MLVGLCYDLRDDYLNEGMSLEECAEFDSIQTIEGIEATLRSLGFQTERAGNAKSLMARLLSGARWDIVFNIAEGLYGTGREALVPALLDAWKIPYTFAGPLCLCVTLDKAAAKRVARDLGIPTPDFAVAETPEDFQSINLPFPLFAKPLAEGTGKGVSPASRAETREDLARVGRELLEKYRQPVLVEEYLPGREFTVGIAGAGQNARALGAMEVVLLDTAEPGVYSWFNKENCDGRVEYRIETGPLGQEACQVALAAYRALGCRDAGRVDVRADAKGRMCFIEVNPLAGIHPRHSDLPILCGLAGLTYRDLLGQIMRSALSREGLPFPAPLAEEPLPLDRELENYLDTLVWTGD
jgi:D-alanine-D-alanine ligase